MILLCGHTESIYTNFDLLYKNLSVAQQIPHLTISHYQHTILPTYYHSNMNTIMLTNIPRSNMPKQGRDCRPDVYPFYDSALAGKYTQLVPPSQHQISSKEKVLGTIHGPACGAALCSVLGCNCNSTSLALGDSWMHTTISNFPPSNTSQHKQWPFSTTTAT